MRVWGRMGRGDLRLEDLVAEPVTCTEALSAGAQLEQQTLTFASRSSNKDPCMGFISEAAPGTLVDVSCPCPPPGPPHLPVPRAMPLPRRNLEAKGLC